MLLKISITNKNAIYIYVFKFIPEGWSSTKYFGLLTHSLFSIRTPEKCMVLNTFFPKVFTLISSIKEKFNSIFIITLQDKNKFSIEVILRNNKIIDEYSYHTSIQQVPAHSTLVQSGIPQLQLHIILFPI